MAADGPRAEPSEPETVFCARHPEVETGLQCGRCGVPICPRCMVHTPGGIRCPDCAMLRRPPMYEVSAGQYARGSAVAAALAAAFGVAGAILLPPSARFGFFSLVLALLAGSGAGSLLVGAMDRATGGKRGVVLQSVAVAALIVAGVLRLVLAGELDLAIRDAVGAFMVLIAAVVAWGRLR